MTCFHVCRILQLRRDHMALAMKVVGVLRHGSHHSEVLQRGEYLLLYTDIGRTHRFASIEAAQTR
jgi:hypothetical protein